MSYIFSDNSFCMIKKIIFLLALAQISCGAPPLTDDEITLPSSLMLKPAGLEKDEIGMVSGVLFEVEDFDKWMRAYEQETNGLIIAFRNVDDPDMTLVFEGSKSKELAEKRVERLTSDEFLSVSSALGDPISSFYEVKYFDKRSDLPDHYVALSYSAGGDPDQDWMEYVQSNDSLFMEYKIEPAGIGTNPEDGEQVYILYRQYDFISFRKSLNSPRKINKFLDKFQMPEHTMISYWVRISQANE